jgi:hypothetical protein
VVVHLLFSFFLSLAGGSSPEVALCDLRMTDETSSKVVQKYCPRSLAVADMVSVSGLDLSRDGQELLVSYESDQVYTFPVFPRSNCSAGPTVDEISHLSGEGETKPLSELACYGGHLNRYTFLKVRHIGASYERKLDCVFALYSQAVVNGSLECQIRWSSRRVHLHWI